MSIGYEKVLRGPYQLLKRAVNVSLKRDVWHRREISCNTTFAGNKGARWCFCHEALGAWSVVYSFGVGEDISFESDLIARFNLRVHAFDPTPRSIDWLSQQRLPKGFEFHPFGAAALDGMCGFLPPENPAHVSHTLIARRESRFKPLDLPVRRLSTTMKTLGHTRIDLLKLDIEGAEYDVISDLLDSKVDFRQLLVEFHHRWKELGLGRTQRAISDLKRAGFGIFHVSRSGEEYGFLRFRPESS